MDNIREILGNAIMAHTNMDFNIDGMEVVKNIFELLEENKENIDKANKIDVKNHNGFKLNFSMLQKLNNKIKNIKKIRSSKVYKELERIGKIINTNTSKM